MSPNLEHEFIKLKRKPGRAPPFPPHAPPLKEDPDALDARMEVDVDEADEADEGVAKGDATTADVEVGEGDAAQTEDVEDEEGSPGESTSALDARPLFLPRAKRGGKRHKKNSIFDRFPIDVDRDALVARIPLYFHLLSVLFATIR